jgi:predicted methyltransferase
MSKYFSVLVLLGFAALLTGCGGSEPDQVAPQTGVSEESREAPQQVAKTIDAGSGLADIVNGTHREEKNSARNSSRHPAETLEFFGIRNDMIVAEIWPAGGWYSEVIAPYLSANGKYIAAHWDPESEIPFIQKGIAAYMEKLAAHPDVYGNVEMAVLMYPDKMDFVPPESVDMIVTFRNIHNWMARDFADDMLAAMYKALKPGGTLGIVEHRGNPDVPQDPKAESGYVNQDYAIQLAENAGFRLVATSEINANPIDSKDYETGVWTLPPTLRAGEVDREWYIAIGESDRFTLKFTKPES